MNGKITSNYSNVFIYNFIFNWILQITKKLIIEINSNVIELFWITLQFHFYSTLTSQLSINLNSEVVFLLDRIEWRIELKFISLHKRMETFLQLVAIIFIFILFLRTLSSILSLPISWNGWVFQLEFMSIY
jgi:hypothetical protein